MDNMEIRMECVRLVIGRSNYCPVELVIKDANELAEFVISGPLRNPEADEPAQEAEPASA